MARAKGEDRGLFQRPAGSGIWWIEWVDAAGKSRRQKVGPKAAARRLYLKRKEEARLGVLLPELGRKALTVRDLVEIYAPEIAGNRKNKKGVQNANKMAEKVCEGLGDFVAAKLSSGEVEAWKVKLKEAPRQWRDGSPTKDGAAIQPGTVNNALKYLGAIYSLAMRDEESTFIKSNPLARGRVKRLAENSPRDRILSPEEERQVLPVLPPILALAAVVALHTGLRQDEQLPRERADYDRERKLLRVPDQKNKKGRFYMKLNGPAAAALEAALDSHESKWIFPALRSDAPMPGVTAYTCLKAACAKLGFPAGMTWHGLRHTFISRHAMAGCSIYVLQKLARHASITQTLRYAHLMPGHEDEAQEKLGALYPFRPFEQPSPEPPAPLVPSATNPFEYEIVEA